MKTFLRTTISRAGAVIADQQFPGLGSKNIDIVTNADGSVEVWFGPTVSKGVS